MLEGRILKEKKKNIYITACQDILEEVIVTFKQLNMANVLVSSNHQLC